MTEQKHTQGPWVCEEYNKFSDEIVITAADGSYVCGIDCDGLYDVINGPIKADAHLIAAAPDMLDDHRGIDETLTFALENGDMPANVRHSITVARDQARAAIAKAKGE